MTSLRFGEKVAALSALALLGFLFLDWFGVPAGPGLSGWDALGWFALAVCVLAIVAALALPFVFVLYESPVLPMFAATLTMLLGGLAVIAILVTSIAQPGSDELVDLKSGWWLGLLAAFGVARGGFLSLRDEYLPAVPLADVPVRPAPPASPAA
jgi:hypothetical protein